MPITQTITPVNREALMETLYAVDLDTMDGAEGIVYAGYPYSSYGSCLGLRFSGLVEYGRFLLELVKRDPELAEDLAGAVRVDSLGRGEIYYFPGYDVEEA